MAGPRARSAPYLLTNSSSVSEIASQAFSERVFYVASSSSTFASRDRRSLSSGSVLSDIPEDVTGPLSRCPQYSQLGEQTRLSSDRFAEPPLAEHDLGATPPLLSRFEGASGVLA